MENGDEVVHDLEDLSALSEEDLLKVLHRELEKTRKRVPKAKTVSKIAREPRKKKATRIELE